MLPSQAPSTLRFQAICSFAARKPPSRWKPAFFIQALSFLHQDAQRLTFEITFDDVLWDGDADSRYAQLEEAQTRLTQPIKYETLRLGKRHSQYIPIFTDLSIDQKTELITGVFNYYLKDYLLDLSSKLTIDELESLLMMRQ
ncbi:RepB family plasmid replication initiator protein [Hymenobacter sublimis]|uniref:Initiator Rep protein WH1 domain-containing protein n=1 Tax=Hymenobacter sublimis TaxID=2933777 RepID=A0ABY4JEZ1_9BACT|nr:RepB family plasmid replication initiator protein [Hymenobacter sublimis]UPL51399.1 hypothetical protein MWH26_19890 [Hymenobacter sublimis]